MFSAELDSIYIIWYRPTCRSNIALPLLKRYRNGVFSLIFANVVGRYLFILNDLRDVEGEFHHIDIVPMSGNISACMAYCCWYPVNVKIAYSFRRCRRRNQVSILYNMVDVVIGVTVRRFIDYNVFIKTMRRLRKSFYTTQCTIKFLMLHISTRLRFKRAHAKSQIPRRSHAQWCIDVLIHSHICTTSVHTSVFIVSLSKWSLTFKIIPGVPPRIDLILLVLICRVTPNNYKVVGTDT